MHLDDPRRELWENWVSRVKGGKFRVGLQNSPTVNPSKQLDRLKIHKRKSMHPNRDIQPYKGNENRRQENTHVNHSPK